MTRSQIIKKLQMSGINMDSIANAGRDEVEIFVDNGEGRADYDKTDEAVKEVQKVLGWIGGYRTGYGAMVLQQSPIDRGDWNDRSSRHHY